MLEKTNNKAITSLILGILSVMMPFIGFVLGIVGLIFSFQAIKEINLSNEKGNGLAIAGRILSIVGICVGLLSILGFLLFFSLPTSYVDFSYD